MGQKSCKAYFPDHPDLILDIMQVLADRCQGATSPFKYDANRKSSYLASLDELDSHVRDDDEDEVVAQPERETTPKNGKLDQTRSN